MDDASVIVTMVFKPFDFFVMFWNGRPGYDDSLGRRLDLIVSGLNNGHTLECTASQVHGAEATRDSDIDAWKVDKQRSRECGKK